MCTYMRTYVHMCLFRKSTMNDVWAIWREPPIHGVLWAHEGAPSWYWNDFKTQLSLPIELLLDLYGHCCEMLNLFKVFIWLHEYCSSNFVKTIHYGTCSACIKWLHINKLLIIIAALLIALVCFIFDACTVLYCVYYIDKFSKPTSFI